ncbi:hypothetical protein [Chengkuizengella marina]|uniref:Uncharacterized protein n=1 Tax=Chengkuizengella marina TaxID=2507566 RepID=A0A6N9Q602_9BACL|nr:hypothetical protein [Chengkuizengella marina]NBI30257.1 hypothetical protein [Chengkuizengella marina]
MNFLRDGLSIDEFKVSILVVILILAFGFGIFNYIIAADISDNWLNLLKTLIYVIAGVNAIEGVSKIVTKIENHKEETT